MTFLEKNVFQHWHVFYIIKKFVATFLALNGVNTIEITPNPIYGILTFCDSYCF